MFGKITKLSKYLILNYLHPSYSNNADDWSPVKLCRRLEVAASRTESTSDVAPSVASVSSVWGLSRDKNIRLKFCTKLKMVSRLKVPQTGNTEYLDGCG